MKIYVRTVLPQLKRAFQIHYPAYLNILSEFKVEDQYSIRYMHKLLYFKNLLKKQNFPKLHFYSVIKLISNADANKKKVAGYLDSVYADDKIYYYRTVRIIIYNICNQLINLIQIKKIKKVSLKIVDLLRRNYMLLNKNSLHNIVNNTSMNLFYRRVAYLNKRIKRLHFARSCKKPSPLRVANFILYFLTGNQNYHKMCRWHYLDALSMLAKKRQRIFVDAQGLPRFLISIQPYITKPALNKKVLDKTKFSDNVSASTKADNQHIALPYWAKLPTSQIQPSNPVDRKLSKALLDALTKSLQTFEERKRSITNPQAHMSPAIDLMAIQPDFVRGGRPKSAVVKQPNLSHTERKQNSSGPAVRQGYLERVSYSKNKKRFSTSTRNVILSAVNTPIKKTRDKQTSNNSSRKGFVKNTSLDQQPVNYRSKEDYHTQKSKTILIGGTRPENYKNNQISSDQKNAKAAGGDVTLKLSGNYKSRQHYIAVKNKLKYGVTGLQEDYKHSQAYFDQKNTNAEGKPILSGNYKSRQDYYNKKNKVLSVNAGSPENSQAYVDQKNTTARGGSAEPILYGTSNSKQKYNQKNKTFSVNVGAQENSQPYSNQKNTLTRVESENTVSQENNQASSDHKKATRRAKYAAKKILSATQLLVRQKLVVSAIISNLGISAATPAGIAKHLPLGRLKKMYKRHWYFFIMFVLNAPSTIVDKVFVWRLFRVQYKLCRRYRYSANYLFHFILRLRSLNDRLFYFGASRVQRLPIFRLKKFRYFKKKSIRFLKLHGKRKFAGGGNFVRIEFYLTMLKYYSKLLRKSLVKKNVLETKATHLLYRYKTKLSYFLSLLTEKISTLLVVNRVIGADKVESKQLFIFDNIVKMAGSLVEDTMGGCSIKDKEDEYFDIASQAYQLRFRFRKKPRSYRIRKRFRKIYKCIRVFRITRLIKKRYINFFYKRKILRRMKTKYLREVRRVADVHQTYFYLFLRIFYYLERRGGFIWLSPIDVKKRLRLSMKEALARYKFLDLPPRRPLLDGKYFKYKQSRRFVPLSKNRYSALSQLVNIGIESLPKFDLFDKLDDYRSRQYYNKFWPHLVKGSLEFVCWSEFLVSTFSNYLNYSPSRIYKIKDKQGVIKKYKLLFKQYLSLVKTYFQAIYNFKYAKNVPPHGILKRMRQFEKLRGFKKLPRNSIEDTVWTKRARFFDWLKFVRDKKSFFKMKIVLDRIFKWIYDNKKIKYIFGTHFHKVTLSNYILKNVYMYKKKCKVRIV